MKKLLFLPLLLTIIGISPNCIASTFAFKVSTDTVRKKLVHPKEAMANADLTAILTTMRGKRNDQEKRWRLKKQLKIKALLLTS